MKQSMMVAAMVSALVIGCGTSTTTQPASSPSPTSADLAAIRSVLAVQTEAWNRGDLDAYMEGYARDDQTMFVGSTVTRGWQTVRDRYRSKYDTPAKMGTLAFSDLDLRPLGADDVLVTGAWELTRQSDHPQGRFTLLFHRTAVGWRIVYDHSS